MVNLLDNIRYPEAFNDFDWSQLPDNQVRLQSGAKVAGFASRIRVTRMRTVTFFMVADPTMSLFPPAGQ